MGGGSGGSFLSSSSDIARLREEALAETRRAEYEAETNEYLAQKLAVINSRDVEATREALEAIEGVLAGSIDEYQNLLFGGSVAKHTYVDGLSDVDALVVLHGDFSDRTPFEALAVFAAELKGKLSQAGVDEIRVGQLAVTVRYNNGMEIQLLPAVRRGDRVAIASQDGESWNEIRPRSFAKKLTEVNQNQGRAVVPAIKLAKAILATNSGAVLSGYHVESLAIDAFRSYDGPRHPMAMVKHLFESAAKGVLNPIRDSTGQSIHVDAYLGDTGSSARQSVATRLQGIATRLANAASVDTWRSIVE
jgi:hypothetical protein